MIFWTHLTYIINQESSNIKGFSDSKNPVQTFCRIFPNHPRYQLRYTRLFSFLSGWAYSPQKPRCKMDAVSRSDAEYALSTPRMRPPSCPDAPLCRALKCLCASSCKGLPFLRSPPPGLHAFFATPTGRCRAKASLRGLRPNRAGTSCKQSFYSFAAKTLYTIL